MTHNATRKHLERLEAKADKYAIAEAEHSSLAAMYEQLRREVEEKIYHLRDVLELEP